MMRAMKNSGIERIGDIPKDWQTIKNKYLLNQMYSGGTPTASNDSFYADEGIPFVSISDMSTVEYVFDTKKKLTERGVGDKNLQILPKGTVLYSIYATIGAISELAIDATISQAMLAFSIKDGIEKQYYKYNLAAMRDYIFFSANGNTQFNLNADNVWNFTFVYPPLDEQRRISDFLDAECSRIDSVIEQTRASIEEYKKLKQSVITQAVTKGIRPNRKMKDSGVEWIGEIPEEWDSINPKALFSQRKDKALPGERQLTASQQYGVIYQDEYMERTGSKVVTVEKDFDILKHVETGDFVISMRSFQGGLEYSTNTGSISSAYVMLVPNLDKVFPQYYRWLLKSTVYIDALQSTSNMVRDGQAMRYSNFAQVRLITVPMDEQKEIANYLDEKCFAMEKLIELKERFLAELESYKKSLIYEYVTGKKEVM